MNAQSLALCLFKSERWLTHLGSVQSSSVACGDAAAQQTHLVQRSPAVHLGQGDLGHHGVLREGAAAHEVEEALAFAGETCRPIWHQTLALGEPAEQDACSRLTNRLHKEILYL